MTRMTQPVFDCGCSEGWETALVFDHPPPVESRFPLPPGTDYHRRYDRCRGCGHFLSRHEMELTALYEGAYVDTVYGSVEGIHRTYERIAALPPDRSDNRLRVSRIATFAEGHFGPDHRPSLLDVGSGLGVFPAAVAALGWNCTALDPDERAAEHLSRQLGLRTICGDFFALDLAGLGRFDVITLNKVIEHVLDPVAMLERAGGMLTGHGFLYVEVPDVAALADGAEREEFTVDHHHVFSPESLAIAAERAGLKTRRCERLREPSGKYTLRAFLAASGKLITRMEECYGIL